MARDTRRRWTHAPRGALTGLLALGCSLVLLLPGCVRPGKGAAHVPEGPAAARGPAADAQSTPASPESRLAEQQERCLAKGDLRGAVSAVEKLLSTYPDTHWTRHALAVQAKHEGRREGRDQVAQLVRWAQPGQPEPRRRIAWYLWGVSEDLQRRSSGVLREMALHYKTGYLVVEAWLRIAGSALVDAHDLAATRAALEAAQRASPDEGQRRQLATYLAACDEVESNLRKGGRAARHAWDDVED